MSVSLNPSDTLDFRRIPTILVKRSLIITNNNPLPIAFKVKTKSPKLYCVQPNLGRVEPGKSIDVLIVLQVLKEELPLDTECKDKFLIQSTVITPDMEKLILYNIWSNQELHAEDKISQQKLCVTYLAAEGQALEEDGNADETASNFTVKDSPVIEPTAAEPVAMLVSLNPSSILGFNRPLTTLIQRSLTITNNNSQPVAFKVKTTAPKQYCSRPNFGRVGPGESIDVSIMLQPLKEEPPPDTECKDKFLIQSTVITPDMEKSMLYNIWSNQELRAEDKIFQQKLCVKYLTAGGQTLEDGKADEMVSNFTQSQAPKPIYITVRENPINEEMIAKYNTAQSEIESLKAQIALLTAQLELRPRTQKLSDVDSAAGLETPGGPTLGLESANLRGISSTMS